MYIKNQPPDGYTFLVGSVQIATWSPIHDNVDFTAKDFTYLGSITEYQQAMITTPDKPFRTLEELIAYSRKNPGLTFADQSSISKLLIGAFMIHGVTPGPMMMQAHGHLIYAIFASMLMANVAHVIVGRIGIRIWGQITRVPQAIVLPIVIPLCIAGIYIPSHSLFEVGLMFAFAALAYVMRKTGFSLVSLLIGFLLGPMLEFSLLTGLF